MNTTNAAGPHCYIEGEDYERQATGLRLFCSYLRRAVADGIGEFIYVDLTNIPREWLVRAWLFFAALRPSLLGRHRIADGTKGDTRVGQDTINVVIGILGATVALLELLKRGK